MKIFPVAASIVSGVLLVTLTGCASGQGRAGPEGATPKVEHVHALALTPNSEAVLIGTHSGIFSYDGEDVTGPIGDNVFDAMGLIQTGGVLYASGHPGPDPTGGLTGPNIGLVSSADEGKTWSSVSLSGTTDFHELTATEAPAGQATIYGLAAGQNTLARSVDGGITWSTGTELQARDLQIAGGTLYVTTPDGLQTSADNGTTLTPDADAPALYLVTSDPATAGGLLGIDPQGGVWTRTQADGMWEHTGTLDAVPVAIIARIAAGTTQLLVATEEHLIATNDGGTSWDELATW